MKRAMIKTVTPTRIIILASSIPLRNKKKTLAQLRKLLESNIEKIKV
jgi:hypothetical protein